MKISITLSDREKEFLQNMQKLLNNQESSKGKKYSLEDVIHIMIEHAITLGESMHRGHA